MPPPDRVPLPKRAAFAGGGNGGGRMNRERYSYHLATLIDMYLATLTFHINRNNSASNSESNLHHLQQQQQRPRSSSAAAPPTGVSDGMTGQVA